MTRFRPKFLRPGAQRGATAVEFTTCALFFFIYVFAMIELSRALYLWNTMTEVTRRAARAAAVGGMNPQSMDGIRRHAMFDAASLPLAGAITDANLAIDYLQADGDTPVTVMPATGTENLVNCTANPNGPACIRFVRVRLCLDGPVSCAQIPYMSMSGMENFVPDSFMFPRFTTISPVGSLGRIPGVTTTSP